MRHVALAAALVAFSLGCNGLLGVQIYGDDRDAGPQEAGEANDAALADGTVDGTMPSADANTGDADDSTGDAAADAADVDVPDPILSPPDASCDAGAPFSTPTLVDSLSSADDDYDARLSVDELTVYFARGPTGSAFSTQIYVASRQDFNDPFGPAQLVTGLVPDAAITFAPSVTADGHTIYFDEGSAAGYSIYAATRRHRSEPFSQTQEVPGINASTQNGNPFITPDGTALYFFSDHWGGVPKERREIVVSYLAGGTFTMPTLIPEISDWGEADNVAVRADQRFLAFSSNQNDPTNNHIWYVQRSSTSDAWAPPVRLDAVNSTGSDAPTWVSQDGCRLYLQSNRSGGTGGFDIYLATRGG